MTTDAEPQSVPPLSRREREVLEVLGRGEIDKEAARRLGISLGTIRVYRKRIEAKLGTHGLVQSLLVAGRMGMVDLDAMMNEAVERACAGVTVAPVFTRLAPIHFGEANRHRAELSSALPIACPPRASLGRKGAFVVGPGQG